MILIRILWFFIMSPSVCEKHKKLAHMNMTNFMTRNHDIYIHEIVKSSKNKHNKFD